MIQPGLGWVIEAWVAVLDGLRDTEVLIGDGAVRDPGAGEGHAHRPVTQQRGDGFETHAAVDRLGGECVAQLVGVDVTDAGALGDGDDMAVLAATVEGLVIVAFDEATGP